MLGNLPRAGGLALCRGGSRVDAGMHRFLVQHVKTAVDSDRLLVCARQ